jgi:photosystem II stability/assembly factor-like uncharacterized protein
MKSTFRLLVAAVCLSIQTYPTYAQWIRTNAPSGDINSVVVSPISGGTILFAATYDGVWRSTDFGTSWVAVDSGLTNPLVESLAVSPGGTGATSVFAAGFSGIFRTTNNGISWTSVGPVDPNVHPRILDVYPGTSGVTKLLSTDSNVEGIILATDTSKSWTHISLGLTTSSVGGVAFFPNGASGLSLFACTFGSGAALYCSTNNGTNWTKITNGMTNSYVYALNQFPSGSGGTNLFAGTPGGIFVSTNNGTSWTASSSGLTGNYVYVTGFAYSPVPVGGANLFASTYRGGVFRSTDNGTNWSTVNTGLTNTHVFYLFVVGTYLVAVTDDGHFWRRPLSELIVSVEKLSTAVPTHFSLDQNYPNPFNPSTTISFSLPSRSLLSLKVFDALGREVAMLVAEELAPGTYSRQWNAGALPSGVYFYRLNASSLTETKKLVLLR